MNSAVFIVLSLSIVRNIFAALPPSMANDTMCAQFGIPDVTKYQYNLLISSPFKSTYDGEVFFPVFSSMPLDSAQADITRAIIAIHGLSRNADDFFCEALATTKGSAGVLVIAPWFGDTQIYGQQWQSSTTFPNALSAYWSTSNWMSGANNSPNPKQYTSSFSCLDDVITAISNKALFPLLNTVVVTGFSAGGQTVNRYSWATSMGSPEISQGVNVRFIVSNPGTYLYLDPMRPSTACYPLNNTGTSWSCSNYTSGINIDSTCTGYDTWKYGVGGFPTSGYAYLDPFVNSTSRVAQQTELMRQKDIRYIFGDGDVCNCNLIDYNNDKSLCYPKGLTCSPDAYGGKGCCDTYPDSTVDNALNTDCESNIQGSNRLQRALLYMSHLELFWNSYSYKPIYAIVANMQHDAKAFYFSEPFRAWAIDSDESKMLTYTRRPLILPVTST